MAVHTNATAGAALGNELRAGTVAQVGSTKRIQALNGMLHANRPNVDITRARAYTKIYKQTEGMPSLMRRYKASAEVYRTLSDNVYDHEQLVGWPTQKIRGANFAIELHAHWLAEDLPNLRERTYDPFDITDEDYRELEEELLPYWKDKTMAVQWGHYVKSAGVEPGTVWRGFRCVQLPLRQRVPFHPGLDRCDPAWLCQVL